MSIVKDLPFESLYLFNLQPKVSDSLELIYFDSSVTEVLPDQISRPTSPKPVQVKPTTQRQSGNCTVCNVGQDFSVEDRIQHYKSDFHRFNIKRSLLSLPCITENEFDKLVEEQSIESLSGSETETESEEEEGEGVGEEEVEVEEEEVECVVRGNANLDSVMESLALRENGKTDDDIDDDQNTISHLNTKSAFIYLKSPILPPGKVFGVYKSLFTDNQLLNIPLETFHSFYNEPVKSKKSALFMLGGGHFAGAIVSHVPKNTKGNPNSSREQAVNIITSKTFHRYTTRRKQGGSQSANDLGKGKANSAGAMIRRYNEQALTSDIRDLMSTWKKALSECEFIFIRASGPQQRKIMVGYEGSDLANDDPRIKSFPFTTKRATTSELRRAWSELSYLKIVDMPKEDSKQKKKLEKQKVQLQNSQKHQQVKKEQVESVEQKLSTELVSLLKKSKAPLLMSYMKKNSVSPNMALEPKKQYIHSPTLLHYAASHGLTHMVQILLINLKADPTLTNESNKTAVELSANPATRKAFQVARFSLGEGYCDWQVAKVGSPKSKEEILQEEKEEQELISKEKKRLIEEGLAKKTELELKPQRPAIGGVLGGGQAGLNLQSNLNGLSDQQKMRLMREQRARAAEARFKNTSSQ